MNPLGLLKKIRKKVKKTVKKVGEKVGVDKTIKSAVKGGRKLYSATAPFNPALLGAGSFLQPGQLGIKNKDNAKLFDRSQQGTRIVGGALLGGAAAGAFGGAGAGAGLAPGSNMAGYGLGAQGLPLGGNPVGAGGFFSGLGGVKSLLAGGALVAPALMGNKMPSPNTGNSGPMDMSAGNFDWNPGGSGSGNMTAGNGLNYNQGSSGFDMNGNYSPAPGGAGGASPESLQLAYLKEMMQRGGLTPEARTSRENRAKQNIRGAQADRGMFNSGLAIRQEGEMMPEIQAQMDQQDFGNLGQMYGMLDPMASRNFAGNQANLDRIYGLQRDRNQYMFGGSRQEDEQDFLARMNYQNQQNQMWNNIGAAGMNYFLS